MAKGSSAGSGSPLPESRINDDTGLQVVRKMLGWTSPELAGRVRPATTPLRALLPGEIVVFSAFLMAGLAFPVSSFFTTVLEFYGLQLVHLTPNTILLMAVFVHFCEMFVGVRPSLTLFRTYFVLRPCGKGSIIGGYYFQARGRADAPYLATLKGGKWDEWRHSWVIVETEEHDRLKPSTGLPSTTKDLWEEVPRLDKKYKPIVDRISDLSKAGLTSLMVVADFMCRRIAPLQRREYSACQYTGIMDPMRIDRGEESQVSGTLLKAMLSAVCDSRITTFSITPPAGIVPLSEDHEARRRAWKEMPECDNISIAEVQQRDRTGGFEIRDSSRSRQEEPPQGGASSKGKEKVEPKSRGRLRRGDGTFVGEPALDGSAGSGPRSGSGGRTQEARTPGPEPAAKRQRTEGSGQRTTTTTPAAEKPQAVRRTTPVPPVRGAPVPKAAPVPTSTPAPETTPTTSTPASETTPATSTREPQTVPATSTTGEGGPSPTPGSQPSAAAQSGQGSTSTPRSRRRMSGAWVPKGTR